MCIRISKIQQTKFTAWNQFGTGKTNVLKCDHKDPVDRAKKKKKYQSGEEAKGKSLLRPLDVCFVLVFFLSCLPSSYCFFLFFFIHSAFKPSFCVACCAWVHFLDVGNYHIFGFCLLSFGRICYWENISEKGKDNTLCWIGAIKSVRGGEREWSGWNDGDSNIQKRVKANRCTQN